MRTKWLLAGAALGLTWAATAGPPDEGAEVARLKGELDKVPGGKSDRARRDTDLRLLWYLDRALERSRTMWRCASTRQPWRRNWRPTCRVTR